jgi:hypothetical protein
MRSIAAAESFSPREAADGLAEAVLFIWHPKK